MDKDPIQVLLVEDNPIDVVLLRETLRQDALNTFNLHTVEFLSDALETLQNNAFNIILIDLGLPDAQGLETFNRIHQQAPTLPKIVLSGLADESLALQAVHAGAQDYLVKGTAGTSAAARAIRYAIERQKLNRSLSESEERFSKAFTTSPVGTVLLSLPEQRVVDINQSAAEILGSTRSEVLGKTTLELGVAMESLQRQFAVNEIIQRGSLRNIEFRFRRMDGGFRDLILSAETIEINNQKHLLSLLIDITERKQAEQALKASEANYRSFVENSDSAIAVLDQDGKILYANPYGVKVWEDPQVVGKTIFDLYPAKYALRYSTAIKHVIETQTSLLDEVQSLINGKSMWFRLSMSPLKNPDGTVTSLVLNAWDLTARKQAEDALRENQLRLELVMEGTSAGIWDWYVQTGRTIFNQRWAEIAGYTVEELEPVSIQTWIDLCHPDDLLQSNELLQRHFANPEERYECELRMKHKNGSWVWVLDSGRVVERDQNGAPIRMTGAHINITERKQAELALMESQARALAMLQAIPDLMFRMNREGIFLDYRADTRDLYDQSETTIIGKRNREIAPPEFADLIERKIKITLERDTLQTFEYQLPIPNRGMRDYEARMIPSGPDEVIAIVRDITEQKQAAEQLRASEEQYRGLMESLDSVVATVDYEGHFLYMNDVAATQLGGMPRDFIGKTIHELFPKPEASNQLIEIQKVIRENKGMIIENLTMVQGEPRWYHTMIQPIHDEAGQVIHVLVNSTDIHDLKTTQQELQELNRTLEERVKQRTAEVLDLYDNAPTGYHSLDADGRFMQVNQTELLWLGYSREEVIGHPLTDFITEQSRLTFHKKFPYFKEHGSLRDVELEFVRKDGSLLPTLINEIAVYDQEGKYETSRSTVFDNAGRAEAEKALRESQANLQNFLDTASDLIQSLDIKGNYIYVNNAWCEALGYTHAEALQLSMFDVVEPGYHEHCRVILNELAHNGNPQQAEIMFRTKHGEKILVEGSISGWINKDGVSVTNGIFRNITKRKQAEDALRLANIELERALHMKDEFLAGMSHELRTPLTGILGLSEALQYNTYGELNEKQNKAITTIENSGRHLLELINDILDISKIEAGRLELKIGTCSLDEICQASLQLIRGMAQKKKQNVMFSMNPASVMLRADGRRLKQILVNLLSNAVKYSPENNSLGLEVNADEPSLTVKITIWDNGIGIAEADLKKLFQPFVQLDSSLARQQSGTGLGLALVQRLVDLHGGSIHVESKAGQGSRFTLVLPCLPFDTIQSQKRDEISLQPQLILIVEDNDLDAERLTRHLKILGLESAVYKSGSDVVEQAIKLQPGVILLDIQLPNVSGWDVLKQLKVHEATRQIPVIITSVKEEREKATQLGAAGYLVKLYTLPDLQAALAHVHEMNANNQHESAPLISPEASIATVMIVDDNETNIFMVEDFLRSKNFNVLSVHSGLEFLSRVTEVQPDVVLMDIQMPDMDGLETMHRLRALPNPKLAAVPVIAITALAMPGDRERCIAAGANEYLSKPVRLMEMSKLIQDMIAR